MNRLTGPHRLRRLPTAAVALVSLLGGPLVGCEAESADPTLACRELKAEVSVFDARFVGEAQGGKAVAFVQAAKDLVWASNTLEQEVASACRRIGLDIGLGAHEMPPEPGPGGGAAGICNAVNRRFELIQRSQGLRSWVTVAAPQCQPNASAWSRCASACDPSRDPQCHLLCRLHANVHAECDTTHVRVRPARDDTLPPQIMNTLQANLGALIHAQLAYGQRLAPDALALNELAALLPPTVQSSSADLRDCVAAGRDVANDATRRIRVSERAATDLLARVQGF